MARLIDANELLKRFCSGCPDNENGDNCIVDHCVDWDLIVTMPTVEAEPIEVRAAYEQKAYSKGLSDGYAMCLMDFDKDDPIVRCKDCKHNEDRIMSGWYCLITKGEIKPDDYCSRGERKNG